MKTILNNIKIVSKNPMLILGIGIGCFIAYNRLNANVESLNLKSETIKSGSVTYLDGKYRVDTSFIRNDLSKAKLIADLEKQMLKQKNIVQEVPGFIWRFLDSLSYDKTFDMVNPGEEWKEGITDYGHVIFKKVYDSNKSDSVAVVCGDGAVLPDKQLVYFGMSDNIALMSYMQGGLGPHPNIIILKHNNQKITDFWYGSTFVDEKFSTKAEILKALKSKRRNGC
jgi:hypothetical protein